MNCIYFDLFNGVSGDMLLASFLDAGLPLKNIENNILKIIKNEEFSIASEKILSYGINGTVVNISEKPLQNRTFKDIKSLILNSDLNNNIKELSVTFLRNLAEAEAKIHNIKTENVHFHEIGAVDTIIDFIGVATAIDFFKIEQFFCSEIPVGKGEIKCKHGIYPNPAPATSYLLKNLKIKFTDIEAEIVTPTGAAILSSLKPQQINSVFKIKDIGYGFGKKTFNNRANFLRIFIGNKYYNTSNLVNSAITEIEFNIDDMTGEELGFFITEISKKDILDIQCMNAITKKNRPSYIVKILLKDVDENILKFIFNYTTTGGIRIINKDRITLAKSFNYKKIENNRVKVKKFYSNDLKIEKEKIEFKNIEKLSLKNKKLWRK